MPGVVVGTAGHIDHGVLVRINEDLILHQESMDRLVRDGRAMKTQNPKLGVGEFKDLTGVSRKYANPLLEYLDRQRVTRRSGHDRTIL
jgi:selenocysteine-specific elongation factor